MRTPCYLPGILFCLLVFKNLVSLLDLVFKRHLLLELLVDLFDVIPLFLCFFFDLLLKSVEEFAYMVLLELGGVSEYALMHTPMTALDNSIL